MDLDALGLGTKDKSKELRALKKIMEAKHVSSSLLIDTCLLCLPPSRCHLLLLCPRMPRARAGLLYLRSRLVATAVSRLVRRLSAGVKMM